MAPFSAENEQGFATLLECLTEWGLSFDFMWV